MAVTLPNKESIRYDTTVTMITVRCCSCGVPFAMPERLREMLQQTQDYFYCPNGHSQHYSKSTETILREKLEKLEQEKIKSEQNLTRRLAAEQETSAFWNRKWDEELKDKKKVSAKLKRVEKRIAHGVCPCCNRTFEDLARHMKTKHPDFVKQS